MPNLSAKIPAISIGTAPAIAIIVCKNPNTLPLLLYDTHCCNKVLQEIVIKLLKKPASKDSRIPKVTIIGTDFFIIIKF